HMTIETIEPGSPAALAGLHVGDVIVRAGDRPIRNVEQLIKVTAPRAGQPPVYIVERAGTRLDPLTITPKAARKGGIIGVTPKVEYVQHKLTLGQAGLLALLYPYDLTRRNLEGIADLIARRSTEGITGQVGMGKLVAEQAQ